MRRIIYLVVIVTVITMFPALSVHAEKVLYAASVDGVLSVHISPHEESMLLFKAPACAKLRLIETRGTWGLIETEKKCGWINLSFTRETYEDAAQATGVDAARNVKINSKDKKAVLYNLPSKDEKLGSKQKYSVPNGMILKAIRETDSGWVLVLMSEEYAWVRIEDTLFYETDAEKTVSQHEIYYIYVLAGTDTGAYMYSEPGWSNVISIIPNCVKLTVRETKENFAYVSYNGVNGWINLEYTTKSLSDAQSNAGTAVNEEYEVKDDIPEEEINIYSVPSEKECDGSLVLGSIKAGTGVFVQRITADGWCLVNYEGVVGWIAPESAVPAENVFEEVVEVLEKEKAGFVATQKNKGMNVYASYDKKEAVTKIPECAQVKIVARKDNFIYVRCSEASGWADIENITDSYRESLMTNFSEEAVYYRTEKSIEMMSIPDKEERYGSKKITDIEEKTELKVVRTVVTGKERWGLAEINKKTGWVNLSAARKSVSESVARSIIAVVSVLIAAAVTALLLINKKRRRYRKHE